MAYRGIIIEESLTDRSVLDHIEIISTKTVQVKESHQTPWLEQWTMHTVQLANDKASAKATEIAGALKSLRKKQAWYADFRSETKHYIIFPGKVFHIDRIEPEYEKVR